MLPLKTIIAMAVSLALLSMTPGCSSNEALKYEVKPLILANSLTDPVKPPVFEEDTDLVVYSYQLLGIIEVMNADRETVRKSIILHNK